MIQGFKLEMNKEGIQTGSRPIKKKKVFSLTTDEVQNC